MQKYDEYQKCKHKAKKKKKALGYLKDQAVLCMSLPNEEYLLYLRQGSLIG